MLKQDIILSVKELLERHWDVYTIASRLKLDPILVQSIIDMLT